MRMSTYSTFSPNNVVIQLLSNGYVLGSQTNFMVTVDRRKLPVLQLGRIEPLGYGRGFRLVSGIIDRVVLNKSLLLEIAEQIPDAYEVVVSDDEYQIYNPIEDYLYGNPDNASLKIEHKTYYKMKPVSLDMLPPLDIIVYGIDETGKQSGQVIYGLEFTSSTLVATVNDVALAERAEWVARSIIPWQPEQTQ